MKVFRLISAVNMAALLPLFLVGCGSIDKGGVDSRANYPDWFFQQEGGVYKTESGGQVIYAMGISMQGPSVQTTMDIGKSAARAELSRILGSHVRDMITTYSQRAADFYAPDTFSETQTFEVVTEELSDAFLAGSLVVDSFFADADNSWCCLMRLDLTQAELISDAQQAMRENFATKMQAQQDEALTKMNEAFAAQDARLRAPPSSYSQD